jgi:thiamine biosynthesis lipoprotein ApbE
VPLSARPVLLALAVIQAPLPSPTVQREAYLMGTTLSVSVAAPDRPAGIAAIELAFTAVRHVDDLLSTWRDDSEIARLNHASPDVPVALSAELYAMLQEAARWSEDTQSAFDPSVGALVDAWDLRGGGRIPSPARLAAARAATGMRRFVLSPVGHEAMRRDSIAWLDTGGFGKGVALRAAERALRDAGISSAFLNFGGQVLALGTDQGGDWTVPPRPAPNPSAGSTSAGAGSGTCSTRAPARRCAPGAASPWWPRIPRSRTWYPRHCSSSVLRPASAGRRTVRTWPCCFSSSVTGRWFAAGTGRSSRFS